MHKIRVALAACLMLSALPATAGPISRADYDAASSQASAAIDAMIAQDAATQAQLTTAQSTLAIVQQQLATAQATVAADQTAIAAKDSLIGKLRGMAPAPTVALTANPASINLGETSTLSLAAVNTETCTPTGWDMLAPVVKPSTDTLYKVDCVGWNGAAVSAQATVAVTIPPPPPPPPVVTSSNNGFVLTNVSGVAQAKYPVQAGLPLVCGEIAHYPQAVVDGVPVLTQADVKNRCEDGSVKFAVVAFMVGLPPSVPVTVKFTDQPAGNNAPLTTEQMLAVAADDARLEMTQPATSTTAAETVTSMSLREMLQAGKCAPWTQGPIAQSMLCVGDDLGFSGDDKPISPRMYATFWPDVGKVQVDVVSEIANSQKLRSRLYDVRILAGTTTAYAQTGIRHAAGTRWVRHVWLGSAPEPRVNRKRDIGYLVDTKFIPPYDPSVVVPESVLSERWASWNTSVVHKQIGGEGWWQTGMPTPGERPEIGWMPAWQKRYLDSGDWRMREIATVQADLFGGFNAYYREGNPAKYMDKAKTVKGLGRPVVPYDRPTSWGDDLRVPGNAADRLVYTGPTDPSGYPDPFVRNGWTKDAAHRGAPDYALYLDTGKYYYLEEAQFWAAQGMFSAQPGYGYNGRGPGVRAYDQVRAQMWLTRDLVNAWSATPDDDAFKAVLKDAVTDFIACFEGERAIRSGNEAHPMWKYCQGLRSQAPMYVSLQDADPLHWWSQNPNPDYPTTNPAFYDVAFSAGATSPWMQNYGVPVFGQAVRQGLPATGIFQWLADWVIWQATSPDYNPWLQGEYVTPNLKWVTDASGAKKTAPIATPGETYLAWAAGVRDQRNAYVIGYPGNIESYLVIAASAGATVAEVLNRPDVWASYQAIFDGLAKGVPCQAGMTCTPDGKWQVINGTALVPTIYDWGSDARWRMVPRNRQ